MAKKKKASYDVSGLSTEQIISMDANTINKLSRQDLARLTSRLVSSANKRMRRLEEKGLAEASPAYQSAMDSGGMFSVKGKNVNQVRAEFSRASAYLQQSTSNIKGAEKYEGFISEYLPEDEEDKKKFWRVFNELKKKDPVTHANFYKETLGAVKEETEKGGEVSDILGIVNERLTNLYEERERQRKDIENSEFSDEFEYPFT